MKFIFILLSLAAISLGIGLYAPTMMTEPHMEIYDGDYTPLMLFLFPEEFANSSFSIMEGIQLMWQQGSVALALLILGFSVIFPILKIMVLWISSCTLAMGDKPGFALHMVEKLGKFSMVDVFVIAAIIVTVKGLPGGTQIHAQWGLYAFTISVLLSMLAGMMIGKRNKALN